MTCSYSSEGVLPLYLDEIPGWEDKDYEERYAPWVVQLMRRQRFDLRSWDHAEAENPAETDGHGQIRQVSKAILEHILRRERAERNPGNMKNHNPHFLGRELELRRLREQLFQPGTIGRLAVIHGLGGLGKTSLAKAFAYQNLHEYGGGCWIVDCAGQTDLRKVLPTLQGKDELDFDFKEEEKADPERKFERMKRELKRLTNAHEPHRCLLALDNVDRRELLELSMVQRLPTTRWLHVIVTTRLGPGDLVDLEERAFLPLDILPEPDALALIEGYQHDRRFQSEAERSAALDLVRLLGGFTLAVEFAAVILSKPNRISCEDFLKHLQDEGLCGLEEASLECDRNVEHRVKSLRATLDPTIDLLEPEARLALDYAALLPAEHIFWEWLESLVGDEYPNIEIAVKRGREDPWVTIKNRLQSLRLLSPASSGEQARMHRLVQEVVRMRNDYRLERLKSRLMQHALARCDALKRHWRDPDARRELEPLTAWARQLIEDDPDNGGTLESALGNLLSEMGRYREAYELLAHVLKLTEERYGVTDPRAATCMIDLGWVELYLGNYRGARWLSKRALRIDKNAYEPEHPVLARDYSLVGRVEQELGNLLKAKDLFGRALDIDQQAYEPNHPRLAIGYTDLGRVEQELGNLVESRRVLNDALALAVKGWSPMHYWLAPTLLCCGALEKDLGDFSESKALLLRAIAILEQNVSPEHFRLAEAYYTLAGVELNLGSFGQAEAFAAKALDIVLHFLRTTKHEHPKKEKALEAYAEVLRAKGADTAEVHARLEELKRRACKEA